MNAPLPRDIAEAAQRAAADPAVSSWVEASAGSGKTKLLTDRLLRLMLGGARPEPPALTPWNNMKPPSEVATGSRLLTFTLAETTMGEARSRPWPSWCCRPSPLRVVRPAVAPMRKPRARLSAAAHSWSPMRWKPNME